MMKRDRTASPQIQRRDLSEFLEQEEIEKPIFLKQSPIWSRAILWTLLSVTTLGLIWVCVAKIDRVIFAAGELEPQGEIQEMQAPDNATVGQVNVKEGTWIEENETAIVFKTETLEKEKDSLQKQQVLLEKENRFYRSQIGGRNGVRDRNLFSFDLEPEILYLVRNRTHLMAENSLFRSQLSGANSGPNLNSERLARLQANQAEFESRVAVGKMRLQQTKKRLDQMDIQLQDAEENLVVENDILQDMEIVQKEGALSKLQYTQQKSKVRTTRSRISYIREERERVGSEIQQAEAQLENTVAATRVQIQDKIAANEQQIEEIDSRLGKIILENEKQLAEIESRLGQIDQVLRDRFLITPVAGTVFELEVSQGFVATRGQVLFKIVPEDMLVAEVFIKADDIGLIEENMPVDVQLEAFPASDFDYLEGTLLEVGSDALPPDELNPYYRYPARIQLEYQEIEIRGKTVRLKPGMRVNANIKLPEKQRIIDIFADSFIEKFRSLKEAD